jgi:cytochrome c oxidase cbb3-type subunit III
VLSAASVVCLSAAIPGVHVRAVLAHPQEPNLQQTPARKGPVNRDSHVFLGLGAVPDAAAAKRGEPLYAQNCAACHGSDARGAQAPNLVRSVVVLHDEKGEEIGQVIKNGRPQGGMPAFTNLTEEQRYDIAEYLHMQVELAANRGLYKHSDAMTSGDAAKGKAFFASNCASCHSVTGDLAKVGTRYPQPSAMLARIAWPASREARHATVTAEGGKKISGTLVHYDDFETTLKAADGSIATWQTDSVEVEIPDKLAGHRALLPKYSDDDLHDLTRYLLTLK